MRPPPITIDLMSPAAQPTMPQQKNGQISGDLYECEQRLSESLQKLSCVVVAFSGGVDSALLAYSALACLGPDKVLAVTADSDSLAQGELEHCRTTAALWGLPWLSVQTREITNPAYLVNGADRCFWCKDALMDALNPVAIQRRASVVLGVNVDDLGDHRPGQLAAQERGALFPLVEAGLDKASIRALALHYGLEVWDRPAMPCLASRIPYGTAVSVALLRSVDRAEAAVRGFGFSDVRVRHYGETARIEVPVSELAAAVAQSEQLVAALTALGFSYVTLDLAGLRSGNLNQAVLPIGSST
ncbi:unannotated protein [freshwater metagenome]|uniref:Unannotated protein n=1 Tax=freshwater metagenome TaxID=449393 RepID=A0A6J7UHI7_9ZZZZ